MYERESGDFDASGVPEGNGAGGGIGEGGGIGAKPAPPSEAGLDGVVDAGKFSACGLDGELVAELGNGSAEAAGICISD